MVENQSSTADSKDNDNSFEHSLKDNYYDTAVEKSSFPNQSRLKPIIRPKPNQPQSTTDEVRTDRYKTNIEWGKKSHKVTYLDHVEQGKPLVQVFQVESYKRYNADPGDGQDNPCCVLF